ncbi:hypothetical protein [Pontibacter liquoris]|uniref:hypothetical protein n=1 Tax=Pontibacter liquoris TaxID=2905677 RepID=UPI001FA6E08F|nr:hypothetical protein [Pontibacter liquoris]
MPYLRHNTLCYNPSLSVRLLVLLLSISIFSPACSADKGQEEQAAPPHKQLPTLAAADTTATRRNTRESATTDLLGNPFVASRAQGRSLSAYYDRISTDFTIDADAIENLHEPAVTDTLFTIRFDTSMLEFYAPTQTGELLLQVADIKSSAITLRNNLRVGMSQAELMNRLKAQPDQPLRITQTPTEVVASNREGAPVSLRFFLKNGKVSRIRYEGYVD